MIPDFRALKIKNKTYVMRFFYTPVITSALVFFSSIMLAQNFCYTTEAQNAWFLKHPELKVSFDKEMRRAAERDKVFFKKGYKNTEAQNKIVTLAAPIYTIPVVFHILHTGGPENISDAQVIDAVNILTRDYNKRNADTSSVVAEFKNLIGNTQIEFILASRDPDGNCTNGILRHWDDNTNWSSDFGDYIYSWPPSNYLNIYVVKSIGAGFAGYTYLPGAGVPPEVDAVIILSSYVGSIGTGNVSLSRVLTHEVGHWLNLEHPWGSTNNPGVFCDDDGVSDTPPTKGFTSCNLNNAAICDPGTVENMQNYMDYSFCDRMFTIGQAWRMQTAINSYMGGRNNLSTPNNLALTGITNPATNCIPLFDIAALPGLKVCSGSTLELITYTYNSAPTGYSWTANNGAVITNPSASSATISLNNIGNTTISCLVSNLNGISGKSMVLTVEDGAKKITASNMESFEDPGLNLPANWSSASPTSANGKWQVNLLGASHGLYSMFVAGENLAPEDVEILESPSYDFKNNPGSIFSFKYAYRRKSGTHNDLFKVQASSNCGGTWSDIYLPSTSSLADASGGVSANIFIPNRDEWKTYDQLTNHPNFLPFKNEENVRFRFYFQEDVKGYGSGNRFYLDEINFIQPDGVNELTRSISFNIHPNPTNSSFIISFNLSDPAKIKYSLISLTGTVIIEGIEKTMVEGTNEIKINENCKLQAGIYFVNVEMNGVKMARKIIIY